MMEKLVNDMRGYWRLNYKDTDDFSSLEGEKIINDLPLI